MRYRIADAEVVCDKFYIYSDVQGSPLVFTANQGAISGSASNIRRMGRQYSLEFNEHEWAFIEPIISQSSFQKRQGPYIEPDTCSFELLEKNFSKTFKYACGACKSSLTDNQKVIQDHLRACAHATASNTHFSQLVATGAILKDVYAQKLCQGNSYFMAKQDTAVSAPPATVVSTPSVTAVSTPSAIVSASSSAAPLKHSQSDMPYVGWGVEDEFGIPEFLAQAHRLPPLCDLSMNIHSILLTHYYDNYAQVYKLGQHCLSLIRRAITPSRSTPTGYNLVTMDTARSYFETYARFISWYNNLHVANEFLQVQHPHKVVETLDDLVSLQRWIAQTDLEELQGPLKPEMQSPLVAWCLLNCMSDGWFDLAQIHPVLSACLWCVFILELISLTTQRISEQAMVDHFQKHFLATNTAFRTLNALQMETTELRRSSTGRRSKVARNDEIKATESDHEVNHFREIYPLCPPPSQRKRKVKELRLPVDQYMSPLETVHASVMSKAILFYVTPTFRVHSLLVFAEGDAPEPGVVVVGTTDSTTRYLRACQSKRYTYSKYPCPGKYCFLTFEQAYRRTIHHKFLLFVDDMDLLLSKPSYIVKSLCALIKHPGACTTLLANNMPLHTYKELKSLGICWRILQDAPFPPRVLLLVAPFTSMMTISMEGHTHGLLFLDKDSSVPRIKTTTPTIEHTGRESFDKFKRSPRALLVVRPQYPLDRVCKKVGIIFQADTTSYAQLYERMRFLEYCPGIANCVVYGTVRENPVLTGWASKDAEAFAKLIETNRSHVCLRRAVIGYDQQDVSCACYPELHPCSVCLRRYTDG